MAISETAKQLKRLRERSGLGVRPLAKLIDWSASRYQYYERQFKDPYLPREVIDKIAPHIVGKGIPPIERVELESLTGQVVVSNIEPREREQPSTVPAFDVSQSPPSRLEMPKDVPIRGTSVGGSAGDFTMNGEIADWGRRPAPIAGRKDVFALYVQGDSVYPWRKSGDLIYVETLRQPRNGDYVVIEMKGTAADPDKPTFVKLLVARKGSKIRVEQFNPPKQFDIDLNKIHAVYRVIDWSELLGV